MVARLVLGLVALTVVASVGAVGLYRYLDRQAERRHERELRRLERRDRLVETAERESSHDDRDDG